MRQKLILISTLSFLFVLMVAFQNCAPQKAKSTATTQSSVESPPANQFNLNSDEMILGPKQLLPGQIAQYSAEFGEGDYIFNLIGLGQLQRIDSQTVQYVAPSNLSKYATVLILVEDPVSKNVFIKSIRVSSIN